MKQLQLALVVGLLASSSAGAEPSPSPAESRRGFGEKWIATRLSIGARFSHFSLEDTRRVGENGYENSNLDGNFLGSLWGIDAQQHSFPSPYLEYRVVSGLGIGVSYDEARAKTLDWADEDRLATAGDGDLEIRGAAAYVVARYRNRTRYEPFANLGFAWYRSRFFESPGWSAPGRRFVVESTRGWLLAAGCKVSLARHLAIDAVYRHSHVGDVAARAYLSGGKRYRGGAFPMRYDALGVGFVYAF